MAPVGCRKRRAAPASDRTVALSHRLQREPREWSLAQGRPEAEAFVVTGAEQANYRNRHFREVCKTADRELSPKAGVGRGTSPKDLGWVRCSETGG